MIWALEDEAAKVSYIFDYFTMCSSSEVYYSQQQWENAASGIHHLSENCLQQMEHAMK